MKKINILLVYLLLASSSLLFAQPINNSIKDVTMPAPNAASLGKYGDIPVSYYTGVPNVGIPIYTLKEGSLSLPVSLSYHAGGVKVGEPASWAGLGWSLQAGGMISRTIQGRPDESTSGWFSTGQTIQIGMNTLLATGQDLTRGTDVSSISTGQYDAEPDVFSFSVGGASGKFYFEAEAPNNLERTAIVIPQQDISIKCTLASTSGGAADRIRKFTIRTSDGRIYEFGDIGDTNPAIEISQPLGSFQQASGWYLKRISSADQNDKINLFYSLETYRYSNRGSSDAQYNLNVGTNNYHTSYIDITQGYRLDRIETTTDKIYCIAGLARTDLNNTVTAFSSNPAKRLSSIKIQAGTYCKEFVLNQTYFQDATSNKAGTADDYRLRLDAVQEKSCDGTINNIPPYTLSYYTDATDANFLPNRFSGAIDHWGYYNAALGNNTTGLKNIPYTKLAYTIGTTNYVVSDGASNRESSEIPMKLGTLNKIIYPTGGSTTFDFEANKIWTTTPTSTLQDLSSIEMSWPGGQCSLNALGAPLTQTFTAQDLPNLVYKWENKKSYVTSPLNNCCNPLPNARIRVYQGTSTTLLCQGETTANCNGDVQTAIGKLTDLLPCIQAGVAYRFEIVGTNVGSRFTFQKEAVSTASSNTPVGGLRIKSITTRDATSSANTDIVKEYDYTDASTYYSSGILFNKPKYGYVPSYTAFGYLYAKPIFVDYSVVPLGSFEGNHIGYTRVKESTNGNGHTIYTFLTETPQNNFDLIPTPPAQSRIDAGNLSTKMVYSANSATTPIATELNIATGESYVNDNGAGSKYIKSVTLPTTITAPAVFTTGYTIRNKPFRLASTVSTLDGISTTTNYTYGSTNHLQATKVSVTNSDGKVSENQTDYSFDVTDVTVLDATTKQKMRDLFILTPIETRTYVAGNHLSGSRTIYKLFDNALGTVSTAVGTSFPRPNTFYNYERTWAQADPTATPVLDAAGAWVLKGTIDSYTGTSTAGSKAGLPTSFTKLGWLLETYTWNASGIILQRKFNAFTWNYAYETGTSMVNKITNPDGQFVSYTYDALMRLKETTGRNGNVKSAYVYTYPTLTSGTITTFGNVKQTNTFTLVTGSPINVQESFTYFDGLGRNIQSVKKGSYSGVDQISAVEYDNQGRAFKSYETYLGNYQSGGYISPTGKPATLTTYEPSPMSRVATVTPPSWYATTTAYEANIAGEVLQYNFLNSTSTTYAAGLLMKTTVVDANGNKTIAFKDKKGRLICMRKQNVGGTLNTDTYYIYDDKDRLVRVITPGSTYANNDLNYWYRYYGNDLMERKKVANKAIEVFQYNTRDLPAFYQDGFLRNNLKWMATSYDSYGRMLVKGTNFNWDKDAFTFVNKLIENTYTLDRLTTTKTMVFDGGDPVVTATAVNNFVTKNFYYDAYGRVLSSIGNNHTNPTKVDAETMSYGYDFADNILTENRASFYLPTASLSFLNTRTFDNWGRIRGVSQNLGGVSSTINSLQYSPKNQVSSKTIGGGLQQVDYTYLENGLLSSINGQAALTNSSFMTPTMLQNFTTPTFTATAGEDLFTENLAYDLPSTGTSLTAAQKNGNISQAVWQVKGRTRQYYNYTYDYLDRLTNAQYSEFTAGGSTSNYNYFNETPSYDARGNITSMIRAGMVKGATAYTNAAIDNLSYTYTANTNLIASIGDAGNATAGFNRSASTATYLYDNNGNMTFDPNKNLTITYNHLNLPSKFTFAGNNTIEILYDATGQKLRKLVKTAGVETSRQDYLGGIELKNNKIEAIYNEEGRAFNTSTTAAVTWRREYNLKDHLGNTEGTEKVQILLNFVKN